MKPTQLLLLILVCTLITYQCTTIQGRNNEKKKKALAFLDQFEKSLKESDPVILGHFQVEKSSEAVMKSIRIMQNVDKDKDSVLCEVNFKSADISFEENSIRVDVPAVHRSQGDSIKIEKEVRFSLWLEPNDGELIIKRIEADDFYNSYHLVIHERTYQKVKAKQLASKKIFFDQARELQKKYDTVIWYTRIKDSTYYYVVNGKWINHLYFEENPEQVSSLMGLVSETGRVIIPPAYDLVGTMGFDNPDAIEVKKNGHVGLFSLSGKELVPVQYDWIIPYSSEQVNSIVKQDTLFGWLDHSYTYHPGFPSADAAKYIKQFGYLSNHINIDAKSKIMARMLSAEHIEKGIVIPPSYLVNAGIFKEIIFSINTGENALSWGGMEYIQTEESVFESITDKLSAFAVVIKERYLGGREEFYKRNNITFVDRNNKPIGTYTLAVGSLKFKKIDSSLVEIKVTCPMNFEGDYVEESNYDVEWEWNPNYYSYFILNNGKIKLLSSTRSYSFTEFVKLDSSYITGDFYYWDKEKKAEATRHSLSKEALKSMRNEILAVYGYEFEDPQLVEQFKDHNWYIPRYSKYESFLDKMTDIDRHNLEFLEKMIGTLRKPVS